MDSTKRNSQSIVVKPVGAFDHPDFHDALALLRATARCDADSNASPEVAVVCQPRPGQISRHEIELLRRRWPLAGIVAIVGSWCEGEIRTGKPWPSVQRFYWYEFPAWWQQQVALLHQRQCPDWARPTADAYRALSIRGSTELAEVNPQGAHPQGRANRNSHCGLIHLSTANRETADVLADVLHNAGYSTVWNPSFQPKSIVRGAVAGIWDGGQLDAREERDLAAFCRMLGRESAPVLALLDFPRRDRCDTAKQLGVTAVLGKPWINTDLVAVVDENVSRSARIASARGRAA